MGRRTRKVKRMKRSPFSKRQVRTIKKIAIKSGETKLVSYSLPSSFSSVGDTVTALDVTSLISCGDTPIDRTGCQVYLKNFKAFGVIEPGDATNYFRIMLLECKNGYDLSSLTINSSVDTRIVTGTGITRVLYDKVFVMDGVYTDFKSFYINRKLSRKHYYIAGTTGSKNKALVLAMISDSSAIAHPGISTVGRLLLNFTDV